MRLLFKSQASTSLNALLSRMDLTWHLVCVLFHHHFDIDPGLYNQSPPSSYMHSSACTEFTIIVCFPCLSNASGTHVYI